MNFILCLFIAFSLNAQDGTGFQEIDPKKDAVILKRIEAEKLLKMMAEKKKAEANRLAEEKRKAQLLKDYEENVKKEKLVRLEQQKKELEEQSKRREQQRKDEEQKRLATAQIEKEKQQKDYEESVNKQLADRKKKEITVKRKFSWLETVMLKQRILEESKKAMERDHGERAQPRSRAMENSPGSGQPVISCSKNSRAQAFEERYRREVLDKTAAALSDPNVRPEKLNAPWEDYLQKFLCNCRFNGNITIPPDLKILALDSYEGFYSKGGRGFRHHPQTEVTVNIRESGNVALVLRTYEPIKWKIRSNGANVIGIVVLGYHHQEVESDQNSPQLISSYEQGDACDNYLSRVSFQFKNVLHRGTHDMDERLRGKIRIDDLSQLLFGKVPERIPFQYMLPNEISLPLE